MFPKSWLIWLGQHAAPGLLVKRYLPTKTTKLVAMADAFEDRLNESLEKPLKKEALAGQTGCQTEAKFVGFDAVQAGD